MGGRLRIREFQLDADYERVYEIWQRAEVPIRPSDSKAEVAKKLQRDPELFLVAERDGLILGAVMGAWDGRRGWVYHLAVHPDFRRQGIGTALMSELEKRLRAKGCLKVNLLVHVDNLAARRLYDRLGYEAIKGYIPVGKEL